MIDIDGDVYGDGYGCDGYGCDVYGDGYGCGGSAAAVGGGWGRDGADGYGGTTDGYGYGCGDGGDDGGALARYYPRTDDPWAHVPLYQYGI